MPPQDVSHSRKYALCLKYAFAGACVHSDCIYSHTLIDIARIYALVGDLSATPSQSPPEKTYLTMEYTKYSIPSSSEDSKSNVAKGAWRAKLLAGGRATLAPLGNEAAVLESISVQPVYPVKAEGAMAAVALHALEARVFGSSPKVSISSISRFMLPILEESGGVARRARVTSPRVSLSLHLTYIAYSLEGYHTILED